jgi:hypothetical protein
MIVFLLTILSQFIDNHNHALGKFCNRFARLEGCFLAIISFGIGDFITIICFFLFCLFFANLLIFHFLVIHLNYHADSSYLKYHFIHVYF